MQITPRHFQNCSTARTIHMALSPAQPSHSTPSVDAPSPLSYKSMASDHQTPPLHPPNTTKPPTSRRISPVSRNTRSTMMSTKTLARLARKWQRVAAIGRKRLTWSPSTSTEEAGGSCSSVASKGHCVVYTADGARFEVSLAFLGTTVFSELLRMSQEEFGFAGIDGGRITLPCDSSVMEYAMCLLRRSASTEMEAAFLNTIEMPCHYHVVQHLGVDQHFGVCSS
ncbi:auxin-responsive protein SAUR36-like [Hordeum vulgare subsp. vulgare]|uniref:auxin-responsive protein SAUR36-like n=1 Tax=Hordeum vulgare subsp. vulgare TaxID=112509 RepID=UPI000295C841|nr:auxin-responsive protein SAUR36-like [Hordeum vulgare subsp. vulgare]